MNTIEYLDAVKARHHWDSDYKLAQELGIRANRVSMYRNNGVTLGENICLQVANLLEIPAAAVLIDVQAERSKCKPAAKILKKIAKEMTLSAASLILTISTLYGVLSPSPALATLENANSSYVYYVKWLGDVLATPYVYQIVFFALFLAFRCFFGVLLYFHTKCNKKPYPL